MKILKKLKMPLTAILCGIGISELLLLITGMNVPTIMFDISSILILIIIFL